MATSPDTCAHRYGELTRRRDLRPDETRRTCFEIGAKQSPGRLPPAAGACLPMTFRNIALLAGLALLCARPVHANDLGPICPDRPGKGTSACTLAAGHAQLELGLFDESFQRRSGVTTDSGGAGSLLAKWGVNDRMDLEARMALYQFQRVRDATRTTTASGIRHLFLHAK